MPLFHVSSTYHQDLLHCSRFMHTINPLLSNSHPGLIAPPPPPANIRYELIFFNLKLNDQIGRKWKLPATEDSCKPTSEHLNPAQSIWSYLATSRLSSALPSFSTNTDTCFNLIFRTSCRVNPCKKWGGGHEPKHFTKPFWSLPLFEALARRRNDRNRRGWT